MELKELLALLDKDPGLKADYLKVVEGTTNASPPQPRGRSPTPRQLGADQDGATSTTASKKPAPRSQSRSPRQSKSQSRSRSRSQPKSKSRSRSRSESPPPRSPTRKKNNNRPSRSPPRRSDEEDSDGAKAPSRNATPSPRRSSPRRQASPRRSASLRKRQTNNSKRQRTPPPPPQQYKRINGEKDECAYTSGEDGNRGGRKGGRRTRMEELKTRKAKNQQVCNKGHWFGRLHGGWFNPYSTDTVNEKLCIRIPRPKGQAGRGDFILHEAMGLTDDYDWFLDVRGDVRKACHNNRPLNADPEARLTWKGYLSGDRKKIFDYLYSRYPFLFHFRDPSGDDC